MTKNKLAETAESLKQMDGKHFKASVKLAKAYRKLNKSARKTLGQTVDLHFKNAEDELITVEALVRMDLRDFRKTLAVARQLRRAERIMNDAQANLKDLKSDDQIRLENSFTATPVKI